MANCFIPNSQPATGRTSTTSSKPLRKQNSPAARYGAFSLAAVAALGMPRLFSAQRRRFNAQRSIQTVARWVLDVGRWTFSFCLLRRVKGAWWPSRSSKPSSPRKWRGRFDSYPLRHFSLVILSGAERSRRIPWPYREVIRRDSSTSLGMTNNLKGGEPHVA
jgi:hypothetical protein